MSKEALLQHLDIKAFFEKHIPSLKENGKGQAKGLCPFHDDKKSSFSVNMDTGLYFCHACAEKGNAIQFIQKKEGLEFKEALKKLKEEEGIEAVREKKEKGGVKKPTYLTLDRIKFLHNQLVKNEKALKAFQERYGLSIEIIEKYLLGFQNERFVIPMEVEPGKYFYKEHKGNQSRGAKVSLYPAGIIKEGLPYIIITEGEFKALSLNQMGFPAVSGTGGANTWKREWNDLFKGLDVIMAYDNDEPGNQGALRVADCLRGTAKSVKAVQWPSIMDGKDKKDVTDFFITLGKTKEDFQRLLESAEDIGRPVKEIEGRRFIEPKGFNVYPDRMTTLKYYNDGTSQPVDFFYAPVIITGRAIDVDEGTEQVEITFKRNHNWKSLLTAKKNVSDARKIVEFADHGLAVNSNNAKKLVEFLTVFDAFNSNLIPNTLIARSTGWKNVQDKRVFVLNRTVSKGSKKDTAGSPGVQVDFRPDHDFERFVTAMKPGGNFAKWREAVTSALKFPHACFAFYASFAAPLLKIFNAQSFIIHFYGDTSKGKTTCLELASSVWGNPHKEAGGLVFGWDSTRVFLERMAGFFCDMPIFPDDSQTVDDKMMSKVLYLLANGAGKGRGSITAIQQLKSWRTIVFSTGERKLTDCTTYGGARARTLELYGTPFPNAGGVYINEFKQAVRENYGHAGPKFIEGLLSVIEKPDGVAKLRDEFKRYHQELAHESGTEVGDRISQYFATVKIAADLVRRILDIGDPVEAEETIFRVFKTVLKESRDTGDMPTNAMGYVLSWVSRLWISGSDGYFYGGGNDPYGYIMKGGWIGIFRDKFAEVVKKEGYSENAVLRAWAEREWIKKEDENHFTCIRRIRTDSAGPVAKRFIIIRWDVYHKFMTGDKDDF